MLLADYQRVVWFGPSGVFVVGWITLSGIMAIALLFSFANSAFKEPLHGRWDPRQSMGVKA
jgi:hypothetical protein